MIIPGPVYRDPKYVANFVIYIDRLREQMLALMDKGKGTTVNPKRVGNALFYEQYDAISNRQGFIVLAPGNFGWADSIPDQEPTSVEDVSVAFFGWVEDVAKKTKEYLIKVSVDPEVKAIIGDVQDIPIVEPSTSSMY